MRNALDATHRSGATLFVDSGKMETTHAPVEGTAIDTQDTGSLGFIPTGLVHGFGNLTNGIR